MTSSRASSLLLVSLLGCSDASSPDDPLDPESIDELARGQGDATGDDRSGVWQFSYVAETCDCPKFELDGASLDPCELADSLSDSHQILEGSGILAITTQLGVLTGAIESNDSFVVASHHDISLALGPIDALTRLDGEFSAGNTQAQGWAGQRLIGELAGDSVDCRWIGSFSATRN